MSIGARIKGWRTALGISQGELARAANVTISAVSRWERDHNAPSHANLTAIVERFGVTLEKFYGPIPQGPLPEAA